MDTITLSSLSVDTVIGVYEWERTIRQRLDFALELAVDIRKAAQSDDLADTLDYAAITQSLVSFVQHSEFQLIETLAERLAEHLLHTFAIPRLKLTVTKSVQIHGENQAQIVIERTRT